MYDIHNHFLLVFHVQSICGWSTHSDFSLVLQCRQAILELQQCHNNYTFRRFLGACNKAKANLDKCLADEYLVRRELNAEQAQASKERLQKQQQEELDYPEGS